LYNPPEQLCVVNKCDLTLFVLPSAVPRLTRWGRRKRHRGKLWRRNAKLCALSWRWAAFYFSLAVCVKQPPFSCTFFSFGKLTASANSVVCKHLSHCVSIVNVLCEMLPFYYSYLYFTYLYYWDVCIF